jgi:predicted RNA-binding protein YlqC (UPF0109 family)
MQSDHGSEYAREHLVESPPTQLQPNRLPAKGENWSASEETTKPQYPSTPSGTGPAAPRENLSPSPCGRHNPAAYPSAVKLLVSNNVAGSIIGRAGQTISELQSQSAARIKLSQTGDFYPGTQDRVCLVQGQLEKVKIAVRLLLERLHMLQEQQHSQHLAWQPMPNESPAPGFDFVVRLLVPSSSCGMIIGKAGSNIKHMEEASGVASVRLSPKETSDPSSPSAAIVAGTSERVVTLTGPKIENCVKCLHIVLDGMMAHHEICRYSNMTTSYSRVVVPGSFNQAPQAGRPVLAVPSDVNPEHTMWEAGGPYNQFEGRRSNSSPDLPAQMIWDQHGGPPRMPSEASSGQMMSPDLPGQMIWDQHGGPPRMPSEPSSGQMMSHHPGETMQPYSPVFADAPASYSHDMAPMMHSPARGPPPSTNAPVYLLPSPSPTQMDQLSMSNSTSAPDLLAMQLQDSLRINNVAPCSAPVDYTHFAPQLPQPTPPGFTAQVLVPDTLIGSILGRGGRTLNELQMQSNTRIRISQRGEYVPGTRNRVVTIRGPTAACVSLAQYLMSQRMVLPPTATYSPQAPYQPSQMQLRHVQQPHMAQQRHDIHPSHYHGPHETAFQPTDSDGQLPPSATP